MLIVTGRAVILAATYALVAGVCYGADIHNTNTSSEFAFDLTRFDRNDNEQYAEAGEPNHIPACTFELFPVHGTIGTIVTIEGFAFGNNPGEVQIKKGTTKILEWHNEFIRCEIISQLKPDIYDVSIILADGCIAIFYKNAFTVKAPRITEIDMQAACPKDIVTIQGLFFGSDASKPRVKLKIADHQYIRTEIISQVMDPTSGESQIMFVVPEVTSGTYKLYMRNLIGWSNSVQFTILGPEDCEPTLITLSSFTAVPAYNKVTLAWETASEIDNAGFNLYRTESRQDEYIQINDAMIPAQGTPAHGSGYTFVDEDVTYGFTYLYRLEAVDVFGNVTQHGPAEVTVQRERILR